MGAILGARQTARSPVIIVMGVAGSGKTSVGQALATALHMEFADGDDFHPQRNVALMQRGQALTDDDRWPWLDAIADALSQSVVEQRGIVIACSALRRSHRDRLRRGCSDLLFVHLTGDKGLIAARMAARQGHFMPTTLLDSQFATLEALQADERHLLVDVTRPAGVIASELAQQIMGGTR